MRPFPSAEILGLDIETTGLSPMKGRIVTIQVSDGNEAILIPTWVCLRPKLVTTFMVLGMTEWLANMVVFEWVTTKHWLQYDVFDRKLVIHNAYFDLVWLRMWYGVDEPDKVWDTMLTERMLTAGLMKSAKLDDIVARRFGQDMDKSLQTSFGDESLTEEQIEYALGDAKSLIRLMEVQRQDVKAQKLNEIWELENWVSPAFRDMYIYGVVIDREILDPLLDEVRERWKQLSIDLQKRLNEHVMALRIEKRDDMQAKLDEFLYKREQFAKRMEEHWREETQVWATFGGDPRDYLPDEWVDNKWHDQEPHEKDGLPKGMRRYVKAKVAEWNKEHKRPERPKLDTSPINLRSSQQVRAALLEIGIELPNLKGDTIEANLSKYEGEQLEILKLLLEFKDVDKILTSFGERLIAMIDRDGRIRGMFNQIGTNTGRPTCTRPNMLQMPKDQRFRSAFRASPGFKMIVADFSQIELRLMAEFSQDPKMVSAFQTGEDLHKLTASNAFNTREVTEDQRAVGKTVNFGILYGMQAPSLTGRLQAQKLDYTEADCERFVDMWHETYPVASKKISRWGQRAISIGYTQTFFGRRRNFSIPKHLPRWLEGRIRRQGANHPIQGSSADITKLAMAIIREELSKIGGRLLLQVYDEIVAEVPEDQVEEGARIVHSAMMTAAQTVIKTVPVQVDCVISDSWAEKDGTPYHPEVEMVA